MLYCIVYRYLNSASHGISQTEALSEHFSSRKKVRLKTREKQGKQRAEGLDEQRRGGSGDSRGTECWIKLNPRDCIVSASNTRSINSHWFLSELKSVEIHQFTEYTAYYHREQGTNTVIRCSCIGAIMWVFLSTGNSLWGRFSIDYSSFGL